ncbi:hypothetical protein TNCV_1021731 [Trichonephila clavipes]|uniref:Uncharacterized protein n=1 Tax=Trichonephila clavipes TaxID=2585209 RepID=A0A8X6VN32_TRICX|nr:hypothetical protein TNCV_1021731 [Trichonephila clavipes]
MWLPSAAIKTDFERLLAEKFHIVCLRSKSWSLETAGRGSLTRCQPTSQLATYPVNKQAEEKVACVGLNKSLVQSLQHVGVHYPAEIYSSRDNLKEGNDFRL